MLYRYDQLHRIIQSRSMARDGATGEFTPRTTAPQAYDEDYSYDANGNLLTLHRLNQHAALKDNFNYSYYQNTNKLKQLIPVVRDTTYEGGAITSNQKVYRKIRVNGNAYVPAGSDVVLKATDSIMVHNDFDVADDASFHAYVLPDDEGVFVYDAIGNLVWDQEDGVKISWTPYGKVREVVKGDTTTIRFRYDGSGNRIEKQIIRPNKTTITRYVRDASGNVMAVYKDNVLIEQSIYGSSRLGLYQGGRIAGHRTLGSRNYEFSNHLGNVLTVISDNIYMTPDSAWTKIISASDYYPFGLAMEDRTYSDTTYRYGFNGKEKDQSGEFGETHYDYGFRIYNPKIAKFLSVDPLAASYPMLTPYQYASNNPILNIDIDGLEGEPANGSSVTLFHNTEAGKEIFTYGFNASSKGKYSSYNWFSTTANATGTGRTGTGVTLGIDGINVENATIITKAHTAALELEAMKQLGYDSKKAFYAAEKTLGKDAFSSLHKTMRGIQNSKLGNLLTEMGKPSYYIESTKSYAVSDALANSGTIKSISGSTNVVKVLNGLKWGQRTLIVVAAAKDLYDIHTGGYKPRTIVKKAGFWTGAWAGGAAAGAGYTATGLDLTGPWGWAGHAATTLVGGIAGGFVGETVTETVYDFVTSPGAKPGLK